jgi:amino-acid N-acetyltransferase
MSTELMMTEPVATRRPTRRRAVSLRQPAPVVLRPATPADAPAIHALIRSHAEEGRLLPRELDEIRSRAARFVVAVAGGGRLRRATWTGRSRLVGCAELAPLSGRVAEVRSLVVDGHARGRGVGRDLVAELERRARRDGFDELCAFTHDAAYFVRLGFSIVPHTWVPEKIALDCHSCPLFRRCGQHAVTLSLNSVRRAHRHDQAAHGVSRG